MESFDEKIPFPKTVKEAVDRVITGLSLKEKVRIANMEERDLVNLHFSLGLGIRNSLGLWVGNEPLLKSCAAIVGERVIHPDDASAVIIRELWKKLRETHAMRALK